MYATKARARAERRASFGTDVDEAAGRASGRPTRGARGGVEMGHTVRPGRTAPSAPEVTCRGPSTGTLGRGASAKIERHAGRSAGQPAKKGALHDFPNGGRAQRGSGWAARGMRAGPGAITSRSGGAAVERDRRTRCFTAVKRASGWPSTPSVPSGLASAPDDLARTRCARHRLIDSLPAATRAGATHRAHHRDGAAVRRAHGGVRAGRGARRHGGVARGRSGVGAGRCGPATGGRRGPGVVARTDQRGGRPATGGRVDHGKLTHASVRFQAYGGDHRGDCVTRRAASDTCGPALPYEA